MAIRLNQNHLSTLERLPAGAKVMKSCPREGRVIGTHTGTNCHVKERAREAHHSAWEHMDGSDAPRSHIVASTRTRVNRFSLSVAALPKSPEERGAI